MLRSLLLGSLVLVCASHADASPRAKRVAVCNQANTEADRLQAACWRLRHDPRSGRAVSAVAPPRIMPAPVYSDRETRASKEHQRRRDWLRAKAISMAADEVQ